MVIYSRRMEHTKYTPTYKKPLCTNIQFKRLLFWGTESYTIVPGIYGMLVYVTWVGGFDSEKTRLGGSAASMLATRVDPQRVSWYTKPLGGSASLP